jgi:hypothetical protein
MKGTITSSTLHKFGTHVHRFERADALELVVDYFHPGDDPAYGVDYYM